jgi:hypothetical protein
VCRCCSVTKSSGMSINVVNGVISPVEGQARDDPGSPHTDPLI